MWVRAKSAANEMKAVLSARRKGSKTAECGEAGGRPSPDGGPNHPHPRWGCGPPAAYIVPPGRELSVLVRAARKGGCPVRSPPLTIYVHKRRRGHNPARPQGGPGVKLLVHKGARGGKVGGKRASVGSSGSASGSTDYYDTSLLCSYVLVREDGGTTPPPNTSQPSNGTSMVTVSSQSTETTTHNPYGPPPLRLLQAPPPAASSGGGDADSDADADGPPTLTGRLGTDGSSGPAPLPRCNLLLPPPTPHTPNHPPAPQKGQARRPPRSGSLPLPPNTDCLGAPQRGQAGADRGGLRAKTPSPAPSFRPDSPWDEPRVAQPRFEIVPPAFSVEGDRPLIERIGTPCSLLRDSPPPLPFPLPLSSPSESVAPAPRPPLGLEPHQPHPSPPAPQPTATPKTKPKPNAGERGRTGRGRGGNPGRGGGAGGGSAFHTPPPRKASPTPASPTPRHLPGGRPAPHTHQPRHPPSAPAPPAPHPRSTPLPPSIKHLHREAKLQGAAKGADGRGRGGSTMPVDRPVPQQGAYMGGDGAFRRLPPRKGKGGSSRRSATSPWPGAGGVPPPVALPARSPPLGDHLPEPKGVWIRGRQGSDPAAPSGSPPVAPQAHPLSPAPAGPHPSPSSRKVLNKGHGFAGRGGREESPRVERQIHAGQRLGYGRAFLKYGV